jgi:hypothetical protein
MRKLLILVLLAGSLYVPGASAQTCLGLPSFASGSVHLNVSGEFPDSATAYALGIGAGKANSLFGNIGGGQVSYEGLDEKTTFGFLEFGYQLPVGRAQLCPVAGGTFGAGPDDDLTGIKVTSRSASAGGAFGLPLALGGITVIPNTALKYEYVSVEVEEADVGSTTETSNSGLLDFGLGLVFRDRFSIQPLVHIPFGGDDDEISFGVFAAFSFGWRAR